MKHPIPNNALDDRLAIVGTAGSGKTYAAGTAVERLLDRGARVVIVDPLDVWWGLRLKADGKTSAYPVVVFGGAQGDLPVTEHAGALIGETVAGISESCIVSLGSLGTKAAERRFMLAFLTALYRHHSAGLLHLVIDEADMFAPQRLLDKDGDAAKLLGQMETIVRRGRRLGFIPWLITQRPAVLSKDVLSQADGLVALKLTASQDRDAIGAWIEGQADAKEGKAILASLPTMQRGNGVLWLPGRGILETVAFPMKATFDSSRAPRRGEARQIATLKPLDVNALRGRLAKVEADAKENDPRALKAELARLKNELARAPAIAAPDPKEIETAEKRGYAIGRAEGEAWGVNEGLARARAALAALPSVEAARPQPAPPAMRPAPRPLPVQVERKSAGGAGYASGAGAGDITKPQQRILDAIAWMGALGISEVAREIAAFLAEASSESSAYANNLGALRTKGLIAYPSGGMVALTEEGARQANPPVAAPTHEIIMARIGDKLPRPQMRILSVLAGTWPRDLARADVAERAEASADSSAFANNLGRLRSLGLIDYPASGRVRAHERLFPDRA